MKISIIVPVYNEEKTISQVLEKLMRVKLSCRKELIVVNDGSCDGTNERVKSYELRIKNGNKRAIKTPRGWPRFNRGVVESEIAFKSIIHKRNLGKGAAVRSGIKEATGDYILIQDADLEYNPDEIPKLLKPLIDKKAIKTPRGWPADKDSPEVKEPDRTQIAIYGSRLKNPGATIPYLYLLGNKFLTFLTNLLYGTNLTDMETGYKLLPAKLLKRINLKSNSFDIEPEITVKLMKNKVKIIEVPISYKGRNHIAGKKLTIKDAFGAVRTLISSKFYIYSCCI